MRVQRCVAFCDLAAADFTQLSTGYIIDKSAHGDFLGNPGMRAELLQLMTNIFVDVLKSVKERGRDGCGPRAILDPVAQILFRGVHQAAIGVVDDHELPGVQQVMGYDQGPESVFGDDAAGVSNDVGVASFQTQCTNGKTRVHAGQNGKMALGARREPSQFVCARVEFVCLENFVDYAHGRFILANRESWIRIQRSCGYSKSTRISEEARLALG